MATEAAPTLAPTPLQNLKEQAFSPYTNNGGTTLAVAGKDFCVLAADTRMSEGYSIYSRIVPKLIKLTDKCVLATSGMQADMATLHKVLQIRLAQYQHQIGKPMSTPAIAQLLSNLLYYKRFFPYYTFNVLGGIDDEGLGCCYSYDAVGSYQRVMYSSSGTGHTLVQVLLDNQVHKQHQQKGEKRDLLRQEAEELVQDAMNSAGERDIYTGDYVLMYTVTKDGVSEKTLDLKFD